MRIVIVAFVLIFTLTKAYSAKQCTQQSDCDQDECCWQFSQFVVVSKRDVFGTPTWPPDYAMGTCKKYLQLGDRCNNYGGYYDSCGCANGLRCDSRMVPLSTPGTVAPFSAPTTQDTAGPTVETPAVWSTTQRQAQFRTFFIPQAPEGYEYVSKCEPLLP